MRRTSAYTVDLLDDISIHAPQWGATVGSNGDTSVSIISIHAPQWGATVDIDVLLLDQLISIHAPQWGATKDKAEK